MCDRNYWQDGWLYIPVNNAGAFPVVVTPKKDLFGPAAASRTIGCVVVAEPKIINIIAERTGVWTTLVTRTAYLVRAQACDQIQRNYEELS